MVTDCSLDAVIQDGGKPSGTSTGTATKETASATSSGAETTPTSSTVSPDQGNSGSTVTGGVWALGVLAAGFIMM